MKIIAIQVQDDPTLDLYHNDVSAWASDQKNGWKYIKYLNISDLIANLSLINKNTVTELEILAHGSPENCDGIFSLNASLFAENLSNLNVLTKDAIIILTSCNTGLDTKPNPLPKIISLITKKNVLAPLGFIEGTYAQNTSRCHAINPNLPTRLPFPGAIDATNRNCYKQFNPKL